jgi:hypothetical protein
MFAKAHENDAIIDGTTVFTFTQLPQSSAMSTTTTYHATFPGKNDGRPKATFVGLFRAASSAGNHSTRQIPHTSHMLAHAHLTTHTQPSSPCAVWGPSFKLKWAIGEQPNWKSTKGWQGKPVSNNDVDPENRFLPSDFCAAIERLTKTALEKAAGHCSDLRAWFLRSNPAMSSAPPATIAYAYPLFNLDMVTPDTKPHKTIAASDSQRCPDFTLSQRRPRSFMLGYRSPTTSISKTATSAQSSPSTATISCSPKPVATDRTRPHRAPTSTSMLNIQVLHNTSFHT